MAKTVSGQGKSWVRRRIVPLTVAAGLLIIGTCVAFLAHWAKGQIHTLRQLRFADFSGSELAFDFTCPTGEAFQFVLATPRKEFDMQGRVALLKDERVVVECALDRATAEPCNWLGPETPAFFLTWSLRDKGLTAYLVPGVRYRLDIRLDKPPGEHSAVWLCWVQLNKDRPKTAVAGGEEWQAIGVQAVQVTPSANSAEGQAGRMK